ncbi:MAG: type II toxin-antitoxin system HicA family toxin [Deltaproteobacteria bacterium]|nr:type II toxin-antitoxin system HicA family toxin [Deltaproteobacteria bacterium]
MKQRDLIRHIESKGCRFLREGGGHTVYFIPEKKKVSTVPRHREINEDLARKICRDLGISDKP